MLPVNLQGMAACGAETWLVRGLIGTGLVPKMLVHVLTLAFGAICWRCLGLV
ncbi:MAG TPA: hypothetical protein VME47_17375 [Acetobacteraceae bacterium]|nr:hypothetical protein [Acetobacteraceae bacterium]